MTVREAIEHLKDMYNSDKPFMHGRRIEIEVAISALEKQIPKKPIKKNPICYEKTKDDTEFIAYDYFCPDCNKQIKATEHHCKCGQALDWGDTE